MRMMRRSALVVTGLHGQGGASERRMVADLKAQGYYVRVVQWSEYQNGMGNSYDVVLGHSMGGARIQADPTLSSDKINTFQSPVHVRGSHHATTNDWLNLIRTPRGVEAKGGHSYQSGQYYNPRNRY